MRNIELTSWNCW